MSNVTGIVEMSFDEWSYQNPDEANATDAAWLEDFGSDAMDAICAGDPDVLQELARRINQHRMESIGSTGAAQRRDAKDADARKLAALRLRWENAGLQIMAGLRSPDLGRQAEARGMLIGILKQAGCELRADDQCELAAAQMKQALPGEGESKCATDTEHQ